MMKLPLPSEGPVKRWYLGTENDVTTILTTQDTTPIIEKNKKLANEGKGYSKSRDLRHIAQIPFNILYMWGQQDGVALHTLRRQEKMAYLRRKLNDPDWRFLRTSSGRL